MFDIRDIEGFYQALRCKICNARTHTNFISFDYKDRKQDRGKGSPENAQLTHQYCNSAIKNQEKLSKLI